MGTILDAVREMQENDEKKYAEIKKDLIEKQLSISAMIQPEFQKVCLKYGDKYFNEYEFFGVAAEEFCELKEEFKNVKTQFKLLTEKLQGLPEKTNIFRQSVANLNNYLNALISEAIDLKICCQKQLGMKP